MSKIELTDVERRDLAARLDTKSLATETMGFKVRGSVLSGGAVVAAIPDSLAGAVVSVCGVKGFMIDERRRFPKPDGTHEDVDCAAVAALEITDSPVHVHERTREVYEVVRGSGRMVLDNQVVAVRQGSVLLIPPGVVHGLLSDSEIPVKVLLIFTPGLAPKEKPEFRDEKIVCTRASTRIQELQGV